MAKIFTFFWSLSKFKKILVIISLFFLIPWLFSAILFYTRYALPTESHFSLEGHRIIYQKMGRYFEAGFDKNNKIINERELIGYDISQSQLKQTKEDGVNINEGSVDRYIKNPNLNNFRLIYNTKTIFDSFLSCRGDSFMQPLCIGWTENNLSLNKNFSNSSYPILTTGVLSWFNSFYYAGGIKADEVLISDNYIILTILKNKTYFSFNPSIYIYI